MLCGISRLSTRSIVSTATFFSTAVAVVQLINPTQSTVPIVDSKFDLFSVLALQLPVLFYSSIIPQFVPNRWYKPASSFAIAVHFSFGLALAGMLQPSKIQNFLILPFSPNFDPTLALVAIGALLPNLLAWLIRIRYADKPVFSEKFELPTIKDIDWKLIAGSAIFGIGWGLLGICPGPGLVLEGAFVEEWESIGLWVLGMTVGLLTPS
jgi:uncharacterized protein